MESDDPYAAYISFSEIYSSIQLTHSKTIAVGYTTPYLQKIKAARESMTWDPI